MQSSSVMNCVDMDTNSGMAKVYKFKVSLNMNKKKILREIEVRGSSNLYKFAEAITDAYGFQLDHAFGFYDNIQNMYSSVEAYTLFYDEGPKLMDNERSVKHSYVHEVFKPNKKMLFYFDFGDSWEFTVECRGIIDAVEYPRVTKKKGEAPPQYQVCSGDEYEGEDEDEEDDN